MRTSGDRGTSFGGPFNYHPPTASPPSEGGAGFGLGRWRDADGVGHSRLSGPEMVAAMARSAGPPPPGAPLLRAAQPGLRRPLCRPARYDFIHSWGCSASEAGGPGAGLANPRTSRRTTGRGV